MKERAKKEKLVTLLVVSVMVASAFGAIELSATRVDALPASTLTLSSTSYYPLAGAQYTLSGLLLDSVSNALAYKPIEIWYRYPGEADWHFSNTVYTDANGMYSTTTSSSKTVWLQTRFRSDSVYLAGSSSNVVTINPQKSATTLTLSSTSYYPSPGQSYTLSGSLTDSAGNPLANKPIDIFYHFPGEAWHFSNTIYTGADGKYSTTTSSSKTVILQTGFPGDGGGYASSSSNVVTIKLPQTPSTTLTLSASTTQPTVGQQYTLSGLLRDSNGNALANKPIDIYYHFPGAAWQFSNTIYTGADGKYSTTTSSSKTVILQTGYKVGGVYVASSNVVTIYPQKVSTRLTFHIDRYLVTSNPPRITDDRIIFSGDLKAPDGSGIPGKLIAFHDAHGNPVTYGYENTPVTATTDAHGHYTTPTGLNSLAEISLHGVPVRFANFAGDDQYADAGAIES